MTGLLIQWEVSKVQLAGIFRYQPVMAGQQKIPS